MLQEAIRNNPREPLLHDALGDFERDRRNFKSAFENYRRAVGLDPGYAGAYNNWGIALRRSGDTDSAIKMYAKAIEVDPRMPQPHYNTGLILSDRKELEKAMQSYRQATEADPEFVTGFRAWAEALEGKGDYAAAMQHYRRVVSLSFEPSYWPGKVEQMVTFLTGAGLPF